MKSVVVALMVLATNQPQLGDVPQEDISLSGIHVGDTTSQVTQKLGKPARISEQSDYLNLHYHYKDLTVSFSDGLVAGLATQSRRTCTPKGLCVGDSVARMRKLYGQPITANRQKGRYYEYYGVDLYCWLQIPVTGDRVRSIDVACQP